MNKSWFNVAKNASREAMKVRRRQVPIMVIDQPVLGQGRGE